MDVLTLFAKLGMDTGDFDKGLSSASGKMSSFGGALKTGFGTVAKIGAAALGAATTAVTGFAAASVKTGMTFDSSMSQVAATLGLSMSEMENAVGSVETSFGTFEGNLRDFAQFMGQNTAFSASQAADALNYMALAGYNAQQSMDMLPNVLNLAAAGSMDLAQASDMITDSQSALGLTFEQTNILVDQMAKTASRSNTSVAQLGEAILTVGGTAKNLVGGTTELNTALGILADNGMKGAEGGTKLRNMIQALTAPTDKASALMEELGVSAFDADGNMRPLNDTFADLADAMSNMTQQGRMETMAEIFNARDIKAAEAMLAKYGERWDELSSEIDNAKGAADEMAKTQLDNLAGDVTLLKSAFEGAQIAVSDSLTPSLREFVQFGTKGLSELTTAFQEGGISGAMDKLGEILADGITMVTDMLPDMINAGMQLLSALGQGLIDNAPQIFSALVEVGGMIGDAIMSGLDSLSEAIAEFDWAGKAAEIAQFLTEALTGDGASHFMETATSIISGLAEGLGQALPELIPAAVDIVMSLTTSLLDNADKLIDGAIALIEGLAMGLINALPVLVAKAPEIIAKLVIAIAEGAPKLFEAAVRIIGALVEGIFNMYPELIKAAIEIVGALQAGIIDFAGRMVEAATRLIEEFKSAIFSFDFAQWGKDMIDSFISGIKGAVGSLKDAATGAAEGIKSVLHFSKPDEGPLADFDTYAPDMMAEFANGITNSIGTVLTAVNGMATSIKNGFTPMIEAMTTTASTMMSTFTTAIQNTFPQLTELATMILQLIVDTINNLLSKILTLGSQLITKFMEGIKSKFGELKNTAAKIIETVKSAIAEGIAAAKNWGSDMMSNFVEGVKSKISALKAAVSSVASTVQGVLGHSHPKEGPMADDYKWMPDMMQLFAQGISDNAHLVTDQLEKVFDFQNMINAPEVAFGVSGAYNSSSAVNPMNEVVSLLTQIRDKGNIVVLEGDAAQMFRVMQREARRNTQLTGEAFA